MPGSSRIFSISRRREPRDLRRIEVRERAAIAVALVEDRRPRQSGLRTFEREELEVLLIVVDRHAPLVVVVAPHLFA